MTTDLSRLAATAPTNGIRLAGMTTGMLALAAWLTMAPSARHTPIAPEPALAIAPPAIATPADPRASELLLTFAIDDRAYAKLADLGDSPGTVQWPARDEPVLLDRDGELDTIAHVREVPAAYRAWQGRLVTLDTGCVAKVTGFDVVARVTGEPGYAADESTDDGLRWTVDGVLQFGRPMLAARLTGCDATTALYARDAALPEVVTLEPIRDRASDELGVRARLALRSSAVGMSAQATWVASNETGSWTDDVPLETTIVRHPLTGATFVSVHGAINDTCGAPDINVWGLYRVDGGALVPVQVRDLGDIRTISRLVDIDGDGSLELVGQPWLGNDHIVTRADGTELARLPLAFYGCPC